ncbi:MAG: hypothetical protein M1828_006545 [Chrysothrix sp. TS-e1954]|nr:MAG: hypothetical protein M1828_006545 [Chrysothrix sp. TS-e1954]
MDLTLPSRCPEEVTSHLEERSMALLPFALYDLIGLTDLDAAGLLEICNREYGDHANSIKYPIKKNFKGKSLREVFEHHLSMYSEDTFEPGYFLAVTSRDWMSQGLLLVTLTDGDDDTVDTCFLKAESTGMAMVNLQIGNLDWSDVKEQAMEPEAEEN